MSSTDAPAVVIVGDKGKKPETSWLLFCHCSCLKHQFLKILCDLLLEVKDDSDHGVSGEPQWCRGLLAPFYQCKPGSGSGLVLLPVQLETFKDPFGFQQTREPRPLCLCIRLRLPSNTSANNNNNNGGRHHLLINTRCWSRWPRPRPRPLA